MEWICPACGNMNILKIKGNECGLCNNIINQEVADYLSCNGCNKNFYVKLEKVYKVTVDEIE